jgi:hypothetical protein
MLRLLNLLNLLFICRCSNNYTVIVNSSLEVSGLLLDGDLRVVSSPSSWSPIADLIQINHRDISGYAGRELQMYGVD